MAFHEYPAWARPRLPSEDILAGTRKGGGFNPGAKFGVGKTPLPSMQRWNRLVPSEQEMNVGLWQDELGAHAPDVFALMQKLRPRTPAASWVPRWML